MLYPRKWCNLWECTDARRDGATRLPQISCNITVIDGPYTLGLKSVFIVTGTWPILYYCCPSCPISSTSSLPDGAHRFNSASSVRVVSRCPSTPHLMMTRTIYCLVAAAGAGAGRVAVAVAAWARGAGAARPVLVISDYSSVHATTEVLSMKVCPSGYAGHHHHTTAAASQRQSVWGTENKTGRV